MSAVPTPAAEDAALLTVNEIYQSIQGESSWAGWRCVFVRLTFCNLRCTYCDTAYAFHDGRKMALDDVIDAVLAIDCPLVEITGGEPLLQKPVLPLMARLCDAGRTVLVETSGNRDIAGIDPRVHVIMDLKCPSSGECARNRLANIPLLARKDEVKFVIGDAADYAWAKDMIERHDLARRCGNVLLSPVFGAVDPRAIVEWMLRDRLDARFQLQLHKCVWDPAQRSV